MQRRRKYFRYGLRSWSSENHVFSPDLDRCQEQQNYHSQLVSLFNQSINKRARSY